MRERNGKDNPPGRKLSEGENVYKDVNKRSTWPWGRHRKAEMRAVLPNCRQPSRWFIDRSSGECYDVGQEISIEPVKGVLSCISTAER